MIDPHVHLRDWRQAAKETLSHGMEVALEAGIDELFDMPNTDPPLTERSVILKRLEDARVANPTMRYHLFAGLSADRDQVFAVVHLAKQLFPQVIGLKLFAGHSTGNMGLVDEQLQRSVYGWLAQADYQGVVAIHAEKESLLHGEREDLKDASTHSLARPVEAEVASVVDQLRFSEEAGFKGHLHVCHLSSTEALHRIEQAKKKGRRVSCAVTPHHVLLNMLDAKDAALGARMNPPLRSETERSALFAALLEGRVDWIETDHAPHTLADKQAGASGIPGFSGLLLLVKAMIERGADEKLLRSLLGERVLQVFGLPSRPIFIPAYDTLCSLSQTACEAYPYDSYANFRLR